MKENLEERTNEEWMENYLENLKRLSQDKISKAEHQPEGEELAVYYRDYIRAAMDALRAPIDKLEMIVDKKFWPVPTYGDLLFEV